MAEGKEAGRGFPEGNTEDVHCGSVGNDGHLTFTSICATICGNGQDTG